MVDADVLIVLDVDMRARFVADANVRRSRVPPWSSVITALVKMTRSRFTIKAVAFATALSAACSDPDALDSAADAYSE